MKTMRQIKFAIIMLLMLVVISIPVKAEAAETRKLTSDEVLTSDITLVNYREVDLNGYKLTLNCDLNLNSPMYFHGGELIVNGNMTSVVRVDVDGKLSVSGNYTQTKDNLIVGGGARITIGGNLNLENQGSISETSYNGIVTVNGNINYNSTKSTGKCPYVNNKPIYRVKGNVIQGVDTGDFNISNIELTGTNQQVILQENARLESLKAGSGTLTIGEYLNVYHLKSDLAPKTSASTIKTRGYMALDGYTLTIDKNLENYDCIVTNTKGKLIVNGNVVSYNGLGVHESGTLQVSGNYVQNGDALVVERNARIEIGGDLSFEQQGIMYEGNYGGIVTVNGNLNYNSTRSTTRTNYVNNKPVYRVKGNIIQGADTGDFIISNIELTGTNQQVILQANSDVESLKAGNGTLTVGEYFNILHLKSDMAPKTAATTLKTNVKVSLEGYTLTIDKNLENNGVIVTNTKGKLIVKGNIVSNKGLGIHESGSLQVGGSYTQVKEDFNIGKDARIEIGGDLNLEDQGYIYEDSYGGIVTINGNINYNSNHEARRTSYVNNKPIYIVKGDVIQAADAGEFNVGTVRLEKDGAKVNVTKGKIDILEVYHSKNRYTITESCYNTLKVICDIKLDANGGTMDAKTLVVKTGDKIGELPTPTRQGYDFIGWYTNNIAGDQVKAGDVSKFLEDTTLWAHWKGQDNTQIRAFVNRLYQILLDREAEPAGLEDWTNRLASGTANAAQIVEGIVNSQEFANKNLSYEDVVERMYQSMLGRASDEGGKSNWTNKLNNGLSANSIINGFSGSVEFGNLCSNYGIQAGSIKLSEPRDQNEGISAFVARCYEKALGRAYEKDGLNYWCKNILDDGNKKQKAEEVASNGFFHSEEFGNKNTSNDEYVEILYRTFLGREYDETGKADWVGKLNSGVSRDEVLYGFSRSQEFSNIMATYGL